MFHVVQNLEPNNMTILNKNNFQQKGNFTCQRFIYKVMIITCAIAWFLYLICLITSTCRRRYCLVSQCTNIWSCTAQSFIFSISISIVVSVMYFVYMSKWIFQGLPFTILSQKVKNLLECQHRCPLQYLGQLLEDWFTAKDECFT